jgi:hypothetical protein
MSYDNAFTNGDSLESETENEKEYAVALNDGTYVDTVAEMDHQEAVVSLFQSDDVSEEDLVTVTEVATGTTEDIFVGDVVDTEPPEPWEVGAGQRFSRREHVDPEAVDGVLDDLRSRASEVSGLDRLVSEVEQTAESLTDGDFECPVCGLTHGHSIQKHDIREVYGVTDKFANAIMQFNPLCHCGLHELARIVKNRRLSDNEVNGVQVFEDGTPSQEKLRNIESAANGAPVPDSVHRKLDERFE